MCIMYSRLLTTIIKKINGKQWGGLHNFQNVIWEILILEMQQMLRGVFGWRRLENALKHISQMLF